MGNTIRFAAYLWIILLIASCTGKNAAVPAATSTPSPTVNLPVSTPTFLPEPSAAPTGLPTVSGEFSLTNTSSSGTDVGVETMSILLEVRLSPDTPWKAIPASCTFNPAAPLVLEQELVVAYVCLPDDPLPADADLRARAEVKIFGVEEPFRMEIETR